MAKVQKTQKFPPDQALAKISSFDQKPAVNKGKPLKAKPPMIKV